MRAAPSKSRLLAAAVLACPAASALAQTPEEDWHRASYAIFQGPTVIGREETTVRAGRLASGRAGTVLTATATYPAGRPDRSLSLQLELAAGQAATARFEAVNHDRVVVFAKVDPRRITTRIARPGIETFRDYTRYARHVILEDSLAGPHAVLADLPPGPVHVLSLRSGTQQRFELADHGQETTSVDGVPRTLHHLTLTATGDRRHLWLDGDRRLVKVEWVGSGLSAVRLPDSLHD